MQQVVVSTREFEMAHGRSPRGRGGWAFFFDGATRVEEAVWFNGLFSEARRQAVLHARAHGFHHVEVGS